MTVNGIDIRTFNAKQLTADPQPPQVAVNYDWSEKQKLPQERRTEQKAGHLKLTIYFRGDSRAKIMRQISEFLLLFDKKVEMELDGYKGTYVGMMTGRSITKTKVPNRYKVDLELDGYFKDDIIEKKLKEKTELYVIGTRETPCILILRNGTGESQTTQITGLTEETINAEVPGGATLIIDGENGLVTIDGVNAFDQVDMWEFPYLQPKKTVIECSNSNIDVTMEYCPMWL